MYKNKIISFILIIALCCAQLLGNGYTYTFVKAEEKQTEETADIRMIFTTDLHGQLTTMNYENGDLVKEGCLSRAVTLINQEKQVKGSNNTFLFDLGDILYDISTDYIYDTDSTALQPIFSAMSSMGYDAITLGNHDFDYTLKYITQQVAMSGMSDACVVSNVMDANTGAHIWNENKLITRNVTTNKGNTIEVKIGVIGETIPSLSAKRSDYTGVLKTEDIVENATKQAAKLKAAGADVVVVLAHSGLGTEEVSYMTHNVSYALTKIEDVDVVLAGHKHSYFPYYGDQTQSYYSYAGYDPKTRLANGKNLIMVPDKGKAIGIADLTVKENGDAVEIVSRKSSIKKVTEDVAEDANINNNFMGKWQQILDVNCSTVLGEVGKDEQLNNYFGLIEDNGIIQLLNSAKMEFAMQYINKEKTKYKKYPIIGASTYLKYGADSFNDYVDISGNFLQSYLTGIQKYKPLIALYKITGKQLREWVEWSASAYETAGANILVTGSSVKAPVVTKAPSQVSTKAAITMGQMETVSNRIDDNEIDDSTGILSYKGEKSLQFALNDSWRNNWSNFYQFDGVEYTINNLAKPRYDRAGKQINNTSRVVKLTVNGQNVQDTDEFVIACNKLSDSNPLFKEIMKHRIYNSVELGQDIIRNYIEKTAMNGTIKNTKDENWNVELSDQYAYVVKSGETSADTAKTKSWIKGILETDDRFNYYLSEFSGAGRDVSGPYIIATSLNESVTNKDVPVVIQASDKSGVVKKKYVLGRYEKDAKVWEYAQDIKDNTFKCTENGIYSILCEDSIGNKSVKYIRINNINKSVLQAPVVDTYSNRKTKITGSAEPNATVYFEVKSGKTYTAKVNAKGNFSYALPVQKAGDVVYVYVVDSKRRASARTVVTVKRTGPNKCSVNNINSNSKTISGTVSDNYVSVALLVDDKTVYVAKNGGKESYLNSALYNKDYKVVETSISVASNGKFTCKMPNLFSGGTVVDSYAIDSLGRISVKARSKVIQQVPNKPSLKQTVTNATKTVKVYTDEKCRVHIKTEGKLYSSSKASYHNTDQLYEYTLKIPRSKSGVKLEIYASNVKGNSSVLKVYKKERVPDAPKLASIHPGDKKITGRVRFIDQNNKKSSLSASKTKVYLQVAGKKYSAKLHADGTFSVKVKKIKKGTTIWYWASNINGTGLKARRRI